MGEAGGALVADPARGCGRARGELVGVLRAAGEKDREMQPALDAGTPAVRKGVSVPGDAVASLGDAPAGAARGVALGEGLARGNFGNSRKFNFLKSKFKL